MLNASAEVIYQHSIERLIEEITVAFGNTVRPSLLAVAQGVGDDVGREKINEAFGDLQWHAVPPSTILDKFDCSDLSYHLSPRAFCYYLPAFMVVILEARDFGWFERLLVPPFEGFEDVAAYFGDGNLFPYDLPSARLQRERIHFTFDELLKEQRACIAEYIRFAEGYVAKDMSPEFQRLLGKYMDFWKSDIEKVSAGT